MNNYEINRRIISIETSIKKYEGRGSYYDKQAKILKTRLNRLKLIKNQII